jgi:N-acetylglucosamine-6-sulfatase
MRLPRLRSIAGLFLALALSWSCRTAAPRAAAEPEPPSSPKGRPNIILIVADDLDLSGVEHMSALKTLFTEQGTTFTNAFVTTSVCCPSRASILTGQYVHNHGVLDNRFPLGGFRKFVESGKEKSTIATWLQDAGYRTGLIGKYLNQYPQKVKNPTYVPPGWNDWHGVFFIEMYYEYQVNENGKVVYYAEAEEDYQTDVLREKALRFVGRKASDARPFFLYLSPFAPHAPARPARRHDELFPEARAPRPPSFNEEDVSDKPAWVRNLAKIDDEGVTKIDAWHRRRVQTMVAVDEMIAALADSLRASGELDNTYVIFTSDNGFQLGAHRMDHGKGDAYEESIRVPMLVRGPGVAAGGVVSAMALNIDLAPTIAALAGAPAPDFVDGRSLVPWLRGAGPKSWRKDFVVEHWVDETDDGVGIPGYKALRTLQHLYVEYPTSSERELYDLKKDPYQMQSVHDTAPGSLVRSLSSRLKKLEDCRAETCRS